MTVLAVLLLSEGLDFVWLNLVLRNCLTWYGFKLFLYSFWVDFGLLFDILD